MKQNRYCIEIRGERPWQFNARNHSKAAAEVRMALGILAPVDEEKLRNRGVERILCDGAEIPLAEFGEGS